MKNLRLLFLAVAIASASFVAACGDDDNPNNPAADGGADGDLPDGTTPPPDGSIPPDGGGGDADAGGPQSFPAYVQTLIETKTNDTNLPDPDTVWGGLTDDDKYVYPATFFP